MKMFIIIWNVPGRAISALLFVSLICGSGFLEVEQKNKLPETDQKAEDGEVLLKIKDYIKKHIELVRKKQLSELKTELKAFINKLKESNLSKPAVRVLIKIFDDHSTPQFDRITVLSLLSEFGTIAEQAVPSLRRAIQEDDNNIRSASALALCQIGSKDAVPELIQFLAKKNPFEAAREVVAHKVLQLGTQDASAVPVLKSVLSDKDESEKLRTYAALILADMGQPAFTAAPDLMEALKSSDKESTVRVAIHYAIDKLKPPASMVIPPAIVLLGDKQETVQVSAALILESYGIEAASAVRELVKCFESAKSKGSEAPELVVIVTRALRNIGPAAVAELRQALNTFKSKKNRRYVITAITDLGAVARPLIPDLVNLLKDNDKDERISALSALIKIARDLQAAGDTEAIKDLQLAADGIKKYVEAISDDPVYQFPLKLELLQPVQNAIDALQSIVEKEKKHEQQMSAALKAQEEAEKKQKEAEEKYERERLMREEEAKFTNRAYQWLMERHWLLYPALVIVLLFVISLAILCFRPIWIFHVNEALSLQSVEEWPWVEWLSQWSGTAWIAKLLKGTRVPIRFFLIVGFFHYHKWVLDAWLKYPLDDLRKEFEEDHIEIMAKRKFLVPVKLRKGRRPDGPDDREEIEPSIEHFRSLFSGRRTTLIISGAGGSGKTSLACQMSRWAIDPDSESRLIQSHSMLPILIDGAFVSGTDKKLDFLLTVQRYLKGLVPESVDVPLPLVKNLMRKKRLLVVIDGYSEKIIPPEGVDGLDGANCPANALIITTRGDEEIAQKFQVRASYTVSLLKGSVLSEFLERYVLVLRNGKRAKHGEVTVGEAVTVAGLIGQLLHDRPLPALLAKMYADEVIAVKKATGQLHSLKSVPDLMLSYLNELNRNVQPPEFSDQETHQLVKKLGYEYVWKESRPLPVEISSAIEAVRGIRNLWYLYKRLQLILLMPPGKVFVQFELDTVAEYLAGILIVEKLDTNVSAWNEFLDRIPGTPENIREFLLVIQDCVETAVHSRQILVPDDIRKRLALMTDWVPANSDTMEDRTE